MSVEFNEQQSNFRPFDQKPVSGISKIVISLGLAKDQAGANKVQLVVALICFSLAIYFTFF